LKKRGAHDREGQEGSQQDRQGYTLELRQSYHWPGNIRELQNIVERSVILCDGDAFWVDEAQLRSQEAPRPKSSGILTETLQK
jgi:transcriptional regulator with AAA-type ATPase domain